MQKTILTISKTERGPIATITSTDLNRIKKETRPNLVKVWTELAIFEANKYDELAMPSVISSVLALNLNKNDLTIVVEDGEISTNEYKSSEIIDMLQIAMKILANQDNLTTEDLKKGLQRKQDWDTLSSRKLPI